MNITNVNVNTIRIVQKSIDTQVSKKMKNSHRNNLTNIREKKESKLCVRVNGRWELKY